MKDKIIFHYVEPVKGFDTNSGEHLTDFRVSQFYINNTNEDVTVVLRNNLPITVEKNSGGYQSSKWFVIRTIYHFNRKQKIINTVNNINEYQKVYGKKQEDLEIIRQSLVHAFDDNPNVNITSVIIDFKIDISLIKDKGVIYSPDTDTLLVFRGLDLNYPHPFSNEGQAINEYHELVKERRTSGIFVELIDNENNINNRYMYVANQLLEIPVQKDKNKKSGVYFTKAVHDRFNDIHLTPEFFEFDKAVDYIGLFKTKEEAISGGNPELITKTELAKLEKELAEAKHIQGIEQIEIKRKLAQSDTELENIKRENARLKEEIEIKKSMRTDNFEERSNRRSDYYEERSYGRKDSTEFLKMAAVALTTAIGMLAILSKK